MILDTVHQALITHTGEYISQSLLPEDIDMVITVYTYTVTDWGNPAQLEFIVWWVGSRIMIGKKDRITFYFCFVGAYWWDFSRTLFLFFSYILQYKIEVIFTVSDDPYSTKKKNWFLYAGSNSVHRTKVRIKSIRWRWTGTEWPPPQFPYVTYLEMYVLFPPYNQLCLSSQK